MENYGFEVAIVIAVIGGLTELSKRNLMQNYQKFSCHISLFLGILYTVLQKVIYNRPAESNFIDVVIFGMAIGFAATGGYENIKSLLLRKPSLTNESVNTNKMVPEFETEEKGMN